MIHDYLKKLGFTPPEQEVFLTLYRLGAQPASIIGRHTGMERTTVYKMLQRMNRQGLVSYTKKRNITTFYISDLHVLKNYIVKREKEFQELDENFAIFATEVQQSFGQGNPSIPRITLFDGLDKISHLYQDILKEVQDTGYRFLRMFASNTHTEQLSSIKMKDVAQKFLREIQERNIILDCYIGDGMLTMERISKRTGVEQIIGLPASSSATNIYVIGSAIYLIIFKDEPIGIKIASHDLAQSFHFLFDQLKIEG
jgi:predicted transcriptional regulator